MAKLIYTGITSLDGFAADETGSFDWSAPDPEVHAHINHGERPIGTYLYGRHMYEVMKVWGTMPLEEMPEVERDYALIWRDAEKIVYSSSLPAVDSPRTRLERTFDPDAVRTLIEESDSDVGIGGPTLAAHAIRSGLVSEFTFYVSPVIVGSGLRSLPADMRLDLRLVESRTFDNGVVFSRYVTR